MAIQVQHQPDLTDYIRSVSLAARNVEQNKRAQAQGELAAKLKAQEDALRSQVVQRGVAGGGGATIRSSDPTGIGSPGSLLSTYQQYQSPMIAPQQRIPQTIQIQQPYGGTYPQQQPMGTPTMQMVTNPYVQSGAGMLGALTSPLSTLGSAASMPFSQLASALGRLF